MYNFLTKNGQTFAFGLGILFTILFLLFALPGASEFDALSKEEQYESSIFNAGLVGALLLVVIAIVLLLAFGLFQIATDLKGSIRGLIGFAILLAIFFAAYAMASTEMTPPIQEAVRKFQEAGNGIISDGNLKFIGGGIITTLILLGVAATAFVVSELINFFK